MTDRTRYHFACVDVAADAIDIFIREGEKFADTIWRQQKTDGLLLERKVFRELYSIQEQDDLPPWPFLVMTRFTGDDVPALALPHTGIVRRADVNKPVANAYFPNPAPDNLAGPADVKYKIEYIDVFDAHIVDYHSVIENYDSIAKKRLVAKKMDAQLHPDLDRRDTNGRSGYTIVERVARPRLRRPGKFKRIPGETAPYHHGPCAGHDDRLST